MSTATRRELGKAEADCPGIMTTPSGCKAPLPPSEAGTSGPDAAARPGLGIPRLLVGALQGRSGKTTVTLGLLRAWQRRGLVVQPFKKGPDFIDPGWHTAAAGRQCRNLDSFLMSAESIVNSLVRNSAGADLCVIEGAMGLFDGLDLRGSSSSAEIAKITASPVILVVDSTRMTRSAAALVLGCQHFDSEIRIAGVILNRVARARQEKVMREAIETYCSIPVLGALPKDERLTVPDRHLGLITCQESGGPEQVLDRLADAVAANVDLAGVLALAGSDGRERTCRRDLSVEVHPKAETAPGWGAVEAAAKKGPAAAVVTLGIVRDQAFSFYYPENLEALSSMGARLVPVNSLTDAELPDILDGLYIGGGFPEVFAAELERNVSLRSAIRKAAATMPIYAECGGLMYLGRSVVTASGRYEMAGVLPVDTVMEGKPQGHGYTVMKVSPGCPWFEEGELLRGHEFHNSRIVNLPRECRWGLKVERGHGIDGERDGLMRGRVFAAYNHIHALDNPSWAESFVRLAQEYRRENRAGLKAGKVESVCAS
ncbi:CobBQ-type GATase domain protein [Acididesulfobacillus acetoxydans]|uniref:Cobyrinate a,c-diamide synthase n=1 Tax=Acididesulfobacillus acetoxydans TaxID=1561005 RepID=A0A8S0W6P4_9FIRM|nr:cobyrinate a,c-diamide synthase [Acididesulfobacillus acetoxydans]CAA7600029.1 CobBQ-type GATase domain protein [Acididesulfobacillus acetoxydans]CEJ07804.1 Cobyrinic acid A,C-diamide synthase [Acididesulfobacillus acetoxydans]